MSTDAKWIKNHNSEDNDQKSRRRSNGFFSIEKPPKTPIDDDKKNLNLRKKQKFSYEEPVDDMLVIETDEDSEEEEEETSTKKSLKRKRTNGSNGLFGLDVDASIWRQLPQSIQEELLCNPQALKMQGQPIKHISSDEEEDSDDSGYASDDALNIDDYIHELKSTKWRNKQKKIVVIGAGIAGVAAARQLHDIGFHVTIVEARSRVGGRIHTVTTAQLSKQGIGVDIGGAFIHGTGGNPLTKLAKNCKAQLCAPHSDKVALYDCTGQLIDREVDTHMEKVFNELLNACDFVRDKYYKSEYPKQKRSKKCSVSFVSAVEDLINKTPKNASKKEKKSCCKVDNLDPASAIKSGKDVSLGQCFSTILPLYEKSSKKLTEQDKRVLDWHISNIEGPCGCDVGMLSLRHWDQDDPYEFTGEHSLVKQGYGFLVDSLAEGLNVELDQKVTKIEYNAVTKKITVHTENTSKKRNNKNLQVEADIVLCTLPLGVLKQKNVEFIPPLPEQKKASIDNLGFGTMNKVALFYEKPFWDQTADYIGYASENRGEFYLFVNLHKLLGVPALVAIITGQAAISVESKPSKVILASIHSVMKTIYGTKAVKPERTVITRWKSDPFACGSYSYVATGSSGKDYDILGQPVSDYLFFAGEATIRTHPSTVSGAYISGIRAAWNIARSCQL